MRFFSTFSTNNIDVRIVYPFKNELSTGIL